MEIDKKQVGQRIKQLRLDFGLTLEEFGKKFNTSKATVYNWEVGRNLPNKENTKEIASLGNITVSQLLYGSPKEFIKNIILEETRNNDYPLTVGDLERLTNEIISCVPDNSSLSYDYIASLTKEATESMSFSKTDKGTLEQAIETLRDFSDGVLELNYYDALPSDETTIVYNYSLLSYQKKAKSLNKLLKEGMDEALYSSIKDVLNTAIESLQDLYNERFDSTDIIDTRITERKKALDAAIKKVFDSLSDKLRNKDNYKTVEQYILQNAKTLMSESEVTQDIINKIDMNELTDILEGKKQFEITYIDLSFAT